MENYQSIFAPKAVSYEQYSYFPARANPFAPPPLNLTPRPPQKSSSSSTIPMLHTNKFSYRFPTESDSLIYQVFCEKISASILNETISNKLGDNTEHVFFYNQRCDNQIYKVTCKLDTPRFLTSYQKKNLEVKLITYLRDYFIIDSETLIRVLLSSC
jgi:hypothetical protein